MSVLVYDQASGMLSLHSPDMIHRARCYSGTGPGRNNPAQEHVRNVGPIPRGIWKLGKPYSSPTKGPLCIPLVPVAADLGGRSGFLIHGDNKRGDASQGCIIAPRWLRQQIVDDQARYLVVLTEGSMEAKLAA